MYCIMWYTFVMQESAYLSSANVNNGSCTADVAAVVNDSPTRPQPNAVTTPSAVITPKMKSLVCIKTMDFLNQINFSTPTKRVCTTRAQKREQTKRKKRREWESFQRNIARTTAAAVSMQQEVSTLISTPYVPVCATFIGDSFPLLQRDGDMAATDVEDVSSDEEAITAFGTKRAIRQIRPHDGAGGNGIMDEPEVVSPVATTPVASVGATGSASQEQTNRKRESRKVANFRATLNWMHRDDNAPNVDAAGYEVN